MFAGCAIGAATGNGTIGAAVVSGIVRQPGARTIISPVYIALVEAAYFINLASRH